MAGLLDQYGMRDHLAQAPQPQMDPRIMQRIQQQAMAYSQRTGMPYQQAVQEAMQRFMGGLHGQPSQRMPGQGAPGPMMPTGGVRG